MLITARRTLPLAMLLLLALAGPALATPPNRPTLSPSQLADLQHDKQDVLAPVGSHLAALSAEYEAHQRAVARGTTTQAAFVSSNSSMPIYDGYVVIDAVAESDPALLRAELERIGARDLATANYLVSGLLPVAAIPDLAALESLNSARPAFATSHVGRVTSEGDAALRADVARTQFQVNGGGITVGTLSDSYNCLGGAPAGVSSGDLPPGVLVLREYNQSGCIDEGRAMIEIIHDLAPGAAQQFRTAFISEADFAQGVRDLAAAGSQVIVDDIGYFAAPMFQDGVVAQAVDDVVADGVVYFSAAGNQGRASYESVFRPAPQVSFGGSLVYIPHDFDPGPGVDTFQQITIPAGSRVIAVLQWDEAFRSVSGGTGAQRDVDLLILNAQNTELLNAQVPADDLSQDPVEIVFTNSSVTAVSANIFVGNYVGAGARPNPGYFKIAYFDELTTNQFDTRSSTLYGHSNASGAIAVGAAAYDRTPEFGVTPAQLRDYSSGGGTPIFFNEDGSRKAVTENRAKPAITAVDGGNTTFFFAGSDREGDGFPNFSGTSAAAPHAAAVAALLLDADPNLSPAQIRSILQATALDMGSVGFDADSGAGLIQADAALTTLSNSVDLQVGLRAEPYAAPSRPLTYTLSLSNSGPEPARGVIFTQTLPLSVSFVSASSSQGSCTHSAGKVTCSVATLAQGASLNASVRVNVTAVATGTLSSSVLALTSDDDSAPSNNSAAVTTKVVPLSGSADLRLSATASVSQIDLAQPLTYTLSISNQGPATASTLTATVKLAASVSFRTASGPGWSCVRSGVNITCTRPSLASGASAPITVGVTTSATTAGDIVKESSLSANTPDLNRLVDQVTLVVRVGRALFLPMIDS